MFTVGIWQVLQNFLEWAFSCTPIDKRVTFQIAGLKIRKFGKE
jgi:hypothetical protein